MNQNQYRVTFACEIDFEVDANSEVEAKAKAKLLLSSWIAENAEASDFVFTSVAHCEE